MLSFGGRDNTIGIEADSFDSLVKVIKATSTIPSNIIAIYADAGKHYLIFTSDQKIKNLSQIKGVRDVSTS